MVRLSEINQSKGIFTCPVFAQRRWVRLDLNRYKEMKAFLEVDPAIEIHLCLSATTRDRELTQAVTRFGVLPVSRMLFTKLDESMSFGCIVNTHLRNKLPLSYFTTGQRVPEDIETATPQRVANLVVREMKP